MAGFLGALPSAAWGAGAQSWPGTEVMSPMAPLSLQPLNTTIPSLSSVSPQTGAQPQGMFGIEGLGANIDTLKLGLGGLQSVAGIWNAMEQNKLAKKSFRLNEGILNTNLANSIRAYNSTLDDRLRSRQVVEGTSDATREAERAKWAARDERRG